MTARAGRPVHLRFGEQVLLDLREGDRVQLRSHFADVGNVIPPKGLDVVAVALSGDFHLITYEAERPLRFHTSEMFRDPYFDAYRDGLVEFHEYRNRILRGEFRDRHRDED